MKNMRTLYFDLLNICACICVVALHCNQMVHTWMPGNNWILALGIEVVFYWAVPIFFMLTGATLMRYRERYDTKTFLIKRFKKTFIPFIAWSLIIYFAIFVLVRGEAFGPRRVFNAIFNNSVEDVYWFFFPLFSIYLSMPALSLLADQKDVLKYLAAGSFLLYSVFPFILPPLGIDWSGAISLPVCGGMILYVILGFLLSEEGRSFSKHKRIVIYLLGIASLVFRFTFTLLSSNNLGYVDRTYFNYMSFPSIFLGIAVFVLFQQLDTSGLEPYAKRISMLSSCSFGVYLIHKPLLDYGLMGLLHIPMTSIALRTVGVPVLYLGCVAIVYIMKKIPLLKAIVP